MNSQAKHFRIFVFLCDGTVDVQPRGAVQKQRYQVLYPKRQTKIEAIDNDHGD